MLFVDTSIIHYSSEGVLILCNILDLLIYRKEVNSLPFIVVRGIHIGKAKKLINQTTFPDCYKFSGE